MARASLKASRGPEAGGSARESTGPLHGLSRRSGGSVDADAGPDRARHVSASDIPDPCDLPQETVQGEPIAEPSASTQGDPRDAGKVAVVEDDGRQGLTVCLLLPTGPANQKRDIRHRPPHSARLSRLLPAARATSTPY
jgi:hypothetical protein